MEATKIHQSNKNRVNSIDHALKILNDAAEDSSEEIQKMVSKDFRRLKRIISEVNPEVRSAFEEVKDVASESIGHAKDRAAETTKETAQAIDKSAHTNPWLFVGGAALASAIVGYNFGQKANK